MVSVNIEESAISARKSSRIQLCQAAGVRERALESMRQALTENAGEIFKANREDLKRSETEGLAPPLLKRLAFGDSKLKRVGEGIAALTAMRDPLNRILEKRELDENLILSRITCPIGVIGMIFESRPDALVQMAALCVRSGNAVILKGGSEARASNRILVEVIHDAVTSAGLPKGCIHLAETRDDVKTMLNLNKHINLIIPRGSNEFVSEIMKNSSIPVLGHADGICHIYLDAKADTAMALSIILDSKMQYSAVCNAVETLLVHQDAAPRLLPPIKEAMEAAGCQIRACETARSYIDAAPAGPEDWFMEYLDAILAIRVVRDMDEAVEHIHRCGSGHTEAIITEDADTAEAFLAQVDAADVFHNCSTRFSDGFVYGLGAELGISTAKIHARGPVGVEGLLSHRWQIRGTGQIIADYDEGRRSFTHKTLEP